MENKTYEEIHRENARRRRAETHPLLTKVFIPEERIERECIGLLQKHGLLPDEPAPIRLDALLEAEWDCAETYAELGESILGMIKFDESGRHSVLINKDLEDQRHPTTEARFRSTLAHEIAHLIFHAPMFDRIFHERRTQLEFFDLSVKEDSNRPEGYVQMCRSDVIESQLSEPKAFEWWEYQANLGMRHLAIPTPLLIKALEPYRKGQPSGESPNPDKLPAQQGDSDCGHHFSYDEWLMTMPPVEILAARFSVSAAFMRVRLRNFPGIENFHIGI